MKKWALIGGGLMLLAWSPWLYAELTSAPAEKKVRELSDDEPSTDEPAAAAGAEPKAEPEPEPEPAEPEAPAEPEPASVAADKVLPQAQPAERAAEPAADPSAADPDEPTDEVAAAEQDEVPAPVAEGPTEVLKHAFETQPRDALWAKDAEARITSLFGTADVPADMLQAASCRKAVCRVEVHWTRERAPAFVSVFQAAKQSFGSAVGILPVGTLDAEGQQQVDLYLSRKGYTVADLVQ
jgi:hypothetical protein